MARLVEHQQLVLLVVTFGGMLLVMLLEWIWPRRVGEHPRPEARWATNGVLGYVNFMVAFWFVYIASTTTWLWAWVPDNTLLGDAHPAVAAFGALLVIEAMAYGLHRLYHAVPFLWRFHAIHHLDTEMDVTTSHRHHLIEVLINAALFIPVLMVLGTPPWILVSVMMAREVIILLSHSNLRFPANWHQWMRYWVVTSDFHRLHHRSDRRFTDSNYGAVLPWFDYLFKTATEDRPDAHDHFEIGLEYGRDPDDSRLDRLLLRPWKKSQAQKK